MPVILQQKPSVLAPEIPEKQVLGARHICFDIETCYASKKDIEAAKESWRPHANTKDVLKIEKQKKEGYAKIELESALLDAAPMGCIALCTETESAIFYCVPPKKIFPEIKNVPARIFRTKTERDMLVSLREWLDKRATPKTVVIGFNLLHFDLPKLRYRYIHHRLMLPIVAQPEARDAGIEVYDVMQKFVRYYSPEFSEERYITLAEVERRLGFPQYKTLVSGAEIPELFAKGKVKEACTYCYLDTVGTYSSFLAMTGQYKDAVNH